MYIFGIMIKTFIKFIFTFSFVSSLLISCGSTSNAASSNGGEPVINKKQAEEKTVTAVNEEDKEYNRSIGNLTVSKDVFNEDKASIQQIIKELDVVMKEVSYKKWITYIDQESIDYWSKPVNLKKASSKLPKKGLVLRSLEDYFKFVFIPSRAGRDVPEIRYETNTYVKAVQFQEEQDVIYYHFNKIDGKWKLHLPQVD